MKRAPAAPTVPGERGAQGEALAHAHLRRLGYRVLTANWRNPRDRREEIDLVALDGPVLVFVEVKARAAGALVAGHHAVDARKKRVLLRAARAYLAGLASPPHSVRLDIVEVELAAAGKRASGPASPRGGPHGSAAQPQPVRPLSSAALPAQPPAVRHFKNLPLFPKGFQPGTRRQ